MWPIKKQDNRQLLILWPNLIPYNKLHECVVTVLFLILTPLHVSISKLTYATAAAKEHMWFATASKRGHRVELTMECTALEIFECYLFLYIYFTQICLTYVITKSYYILYYFYIYNKLVIFKIIKH